MFAAIIQNIRKLSRKQREINNRELSIFLDEESFRRFQQLKVKIPKHDNSELIALALRCLEEKTNRITRKLIKKKVHGLKNKGLSNQQIADHLNDNEIPTFGKKFKWDTGTVSELLNKFER
jgi:hypothetical protein